MANRHLTRALNHGKQGNIEESLKSYAVMDYVNDGGRFYSVKELVPITSLPVGSEDEIEIRLTDSDFHVMQFHDSFITFNLKTTLVFSHDLISTTDYNKMSSSQQEMLKHQFIFVGFKSGSHVMREYTVVHRGRTISSTMQNQGTLEAFFANLYKPKSEKNNRRYIHSLYQSVHNYDTSACGTYVPITDIKANTPLQVDIPISVPIDDILLFSGFRDYPNSLFGEMIMKFRVNPNALVYCRVDPIKSSSRSFVELHKNLTDETEKKRFRRMLFTIMDTLRGPDVDAHYTKQYTQIGNRSSQFGWRLNADPGAGDVDLDLGIINSFDNFTANVSSMLIQRCNAVLAGYRASEKCLASLKDYFTTNPFIVPAQRVEVKIMGSSPTVNGFQQCQTNIPLNHVSDFMIVFPKDSKQITCFENPMYQDLQLTVGNRNFPERPITTCNDPSFFQMMINASDLDSLFEATDEYEDSLTRARSSSKHVLTPDTDLTSFAVTLQAERSGGMGIYFDGINSNGENVSIDLRGSPIHRDDVDTYYRPRLHAGDPGTINTQAPLLCMLQDTFWIFTSVDRGTCEYIRDYTAEEVITKRGFAKDD